MGFCTLGLVENSKCVGFCTLGSVENSKVYGILYLGFGGELEVYGILYLGFGGELPAEHDAGRVDVHGDGVAPAVLDPHVRVVRDVAARDLIHCQRAARQQAANIQNTVSVRHDSRLQREMGLGSARLQTQVSSSQGYRKPVVCVSKKIGTGNQVL